MRINIISVFAKPGAGKDTQIDRCVEIYPDRAGKVYPGGLFRQAYNNVTDPFHSLIAPYSDLITTGRYVPAEVFLPIVQSKTSQLIDEGKDIIFFSGYPYTIDYLNAAKQMYGELEQKGHALKYLYLFLAITNREAQTRLLHRNGKESEGQVRRVDDDCQEIILQRIKLWTQNTQEARRHIFTAERATSAISVIEAVGTQDEVAKRFQNEVSNFIGGKVSEIH